MPFESAYTGPQIDRAIGSVLKKESAWDAKLDKPLGSPNQVLGFDALGNIVARGTGDLVGPPGESGADGQPGKDGAPGKSAYEVAVENGFVGTEQAWLLSLRGAAGATPEIAIGKVATLEPDQSATATLTGTAEAPVLSLGIPRGHPGETGNLDSPAHSINETMGPAPEVSTDVAAPGSHLQPVSEIKLVQEGEGVPSLTNIRNITGWDNITLTHNSETATQALPETVYGGRYDWEAGVLTVTHAGFNLAVADMNFSEQFPGWHIEKSVINEIVRDGFLGTVSSVVSNITKLLSINNGMQNPTIYLHPAHHGDMTQSGWKAQYPNLICQFVVPLLEPRTIQLTPREFAALSGVNTLSSDCGDTTVIFSADLKKYIDAGDASHSGTGGGGGVTIESDPTVPDWAKQPQKPVYTAEEVGARPVTWTPSAADVGARPATWTPTASEVGARASDWMPTASEVGARPDTWTPTAQQVGAIPSGAVAAVQVLTEAEYTALTTKDPTTLYLIKE